MNRQVKDTKRTQLVILPGKAVEAIYLADIYSCWAPSDDWTAPPVQGKPKPEYVLDLDRVPTLHTARIITVEPHEIVAKVHNWTPQDVGSLRCKTGYSCLGDSSEVAEAFCNAF